MGTTTNGLPYPDDDLPIADFPAAMKSLADAVDAKMSAPKYQMGQGTVPGVSGAATLSATINLDSAIFKGNPPSRVIVTPRDGYSDVAHVYVAGRAANAFTVGARRIDGATFSTTAVTIDYVAFV